MGMLALAGESWAEAHRPSPSRPVPLAFLLNSRGERFLALRMSRSNLAAGL